MPLRTEPCQDVVWVGGTLRRALAGAGRLSAEERAASGRFRLEARRRAFLAGRVAAHAALDVLGVAGGRVVLAADDGAPEPWLGGQRLPVSLSIAHRGDRVAAAVIPWPRIVGCDVERIEPRTEGFVRDFLTQEEAEGVARSADPALAANLAWAGKEAVLKVRRTGLRRDTRTVVVRLPDAAGEAGWTVMDVRDTCDPGPVRAWWRTWDGYVAVLAVGG